MKSTVDPKRRQAGVLLALLLALGAVAPVLAGTRMLRYPDVHAEQVVFSYAGDLWLAPISGDTPARRLTSHPGLELFPRFSPDGTQVAFTGQYRGDDQVYVIDIAGGEPRQLTWYPTDGPLPARWGVEHQVYGWKPDGSAVLFRSQREDFNDRRLYTVDLAGGLPQVLPMPRAGSGDFSPDGTQIVYSPLFRDFRTWKRYQGGWAQNLYVYNLNETSSSQLTSHIRTERDPVWLSSGIYFVSDRNGKLELYGPGANGASQAKLTDSDGWDIKWASGDGDQQIVYEAAGTIGHFDAATGRQQLLDITVPDDRVRRTLRRIDASKQIEGYDLSSDGKRVLFTARGDVFSAPVEHGITRNLTQRGNAHDREATWSPDGSLVAFVSDRSGEEQIYVVPHDGGEARALTPSRAARIYGLSWAPDGESLAFRDHTGRVRVVDLEGQETDVVYTTLDGVNDYVWSPDSRYLAFSQEMESGMNAVFVWSANSGDTRMVTDGFFQAFGPAFGADGEHLFFVGDREYAPQIGSFEWNYVVDRESRVYALALNTDSPNPFGPRNDETGKSDDDESKDKEEDDEDEEMRVEIDFDGIARRVIRLPIDASNIFGVQSVDGGLIYLTGSPFVYGRQGPTPNKLFRFDFEKRESKELATSFRGLSVPSSGKYLLLRTGDGFSRIEVSDGDKKTQVSTANLIVHRAPAEEWPVVFDEVWRRFRDYFYVANLHGYDWEALREQYRPLVADVSTREDLNTLMGEMIAELNAGHAYVSGGDLQAGDRSSVGLLGARFELDGDHYRFTHIYDGDNAEPKYRAPLNEVGVNISEGDYLLAVNGRTLTAADNPYSLLTDLGSQPVELLVNDKPTEKDARRVLVDPISGESNLIYLEWVEKNRRYVAEKTDGKVGYLHIPDMGSAGIYEFIKWYYPQRRMQGLVVDVRGNGGGNVSQMILRRLMLKPLGYGYQAHRTAVQSYPGPAFNGHMVALISEDSASDGDIFPHYFRKAGLGPLIGKRSWGGVVGITNHGPLIDGGSVNVPEFGIGDAENGWIVEGEGVPPDIEVANDPATGADAQLDRGIAEVMAKIEADPPQWPAKPADPVKLD
ncbi:MAG: S41 family peptidase [Pseudomonadota bacterium]